MGSMDLDEKARAVMEEVRKILEKFGFNLKDVLFTTDSKESQLENRLTIDGTTVSHVGGYRFSAEDDSLSLRSFNSKIHTGKLVRNRIIPIKGIQLIKLRLRRLLTFYLPKRKP